MTVIATNSCVRTSSCRDELGAEVVMGEKRNMRGETFAMIPAGLRSAAHAWYDPTEVKADFGFRPARTIP